MKKRKIALIFTLFIAFLFLIAPITNIRANAKESTGSDGIPYETYTLGTGSRLVPTQTAYVPNGILNDASVVLKSPRDMYYYDSNIYVADTGNKRIVILNDQGLLENEIKHNEFVEPTGVFVTDEFVYVADKKAKKIFLFDHSLNKVNEYGKPTEILFGKNNDFVPTKICVASSGLMYIIGEGSTNGVITINKYGEFMGYVGINTTTFSLRKYIYNFFVSGGSLAKQTPSAPTNLTIGANGNIFTTNATDIAESFKRLNISGSNTLDGDTYYPSEEISDITISDDNYIYISTITGDIYEYDVNGKLLFKFNTTDTGNQDVLGLTARIDSIEVDNAGNIYALDATKNNIQIYQRTAFVNILHQAVDMYNDGKYLQSKDLWETVLEQNNNFAFAHTALGWSYFKEGNNSAALKEFYLSKNYGGYSAVFWEIRNQYLQKNTGYLVLILILIVIAIKIIKKVLYRNAIVLDNGKKIPVFANNIQENYRSKEHNKFTVWIVTRLKELKYSFHMLKHPADTCYGIKKQRKASYSSAIIILVLFLLTYILDLYASSFIFRYHGGFNSVLGQLLIIVGIFVLWCAVNYLISTLNDGEGWFRDIFISTCYCLLPFILIKLPLIPLSYCLTYNEAFIISIANLVAKAWCIILLLVSIINIHNYSFKETLKNILLTLFGMILIALTIMLVYMFMAQLIDFITSIIKEVFIRG